MDEEKYFSPNDIAQKYNIKADTVRKWIKQDKLKAIKLGDIWRIPESALEKFIEENNKK